MGRGGRGGFKKHPNSFWSKRPRNDEDAAALTGDGGDQRRSNEQAPHEGSVPLEEVKSSAEYARRIENYNVYTTKHKFALCFGYIGTNFQGLQINKDALSIEACLEKALFLVGAIQEFNYGNLHKIQWTRAARTDKGVHAIAQCCAMKIHAPCAVAERPAFIEQVNNFLPADIRLFGFTKVAKSFNSKNAVTKRRYQYLLPTYVLDDFSNTNAVFEAVAKKQQADSASAQHHASNSDLLSNASLQEAYCKLKDYRVSSDRLSLLRQALKAYEGTRRYHNFTPRMAPGDNKAKRYIISFESSEAFVDTTTGCEWVLLSITGQSFMLNQIRKMIGLAVEVARGVSPLGAIDEAFESGKVRVPTAPGIGLYLDQLYFDQYNTMQGYRTEGDRKRKTPSADADELQRRDDDDKDDHREDKDVSKDGSPQREFLDWHDDPLMVAVMSTFRNEQIRPHVLAEEGRQLSFTNYLYSIRGATYEYEEREGEGEEREGEGEEQ